MTRFLGANWLWIAVIVALLVMHRGGGCGMHGGHHQHRSDHDGKHDPNQEAARSGQDHGATVDTARRDDHEPDNPTPIDPSRRGASRERLQ